MAAPRINLVLRAHIGNGQVQWHGYGRQQWEALLLRNEGKDVEIVMRRPQRKRSDPQNRYLWGVVYDTLSQYTGHTREEIHEAMRWKFLRVRGDGPLETVRSTTQLSTVEFEEYTENIRQFAVMELPDPVYIPLPNEVDMEQITA